MNTQNLISLMINSGIELQEAKREIKMLKEHFFCYTDVDEVRGRVLEENEVKLLNEKIHQRIKTRKPIQYIIGEAYFMGDYYKVDENVLIPRDETELVVTKAIEIIKKNNYHKILDIGTGSGCIACSIAKYTSTEVLGVDVSNEALHVALENATRLNLNNKAVFRKSDLFSKIHDDEKFDLIISNPPYIPFGTTLDKEVTYEPSLALFAEKNGLAFYENIIENSSKYLNKNGYLIFELGINQSDNVSNMMRKKNFKNIVIDKDLASIDRIIYGNI